VLLKGVQMLLDAMVDFLASPIDLPLTKAFVNNDNPIKIRHDDNRKKIVLGFELMNDRDVGK
jgi:elongation factor G